MSIFYLNDEKTVEGQEFFDKYDLAKFIDGNSDSPENTKTRIRKVVTMEFNNV